MASDLAYGQNTELLFHFNGANGATSFLNSALYPKTIAAFGGASISTAKSKFGSSSLYLDGAGDYVTVTGSGITLGTGDFTIECFVNMSSVSGTPAIFDCRPNGGNGWYPSLYVYSNQLQWFSNSTQLINAAATQTVGVWFHVAVVRISGVTKIYKDGVFIGSAYTDANSYIGTTMYIGASGNNPSLFNLNAYIDEFRVIKGIGIYSANFTPPVQQLPDPA
jgi:hypothetical protein